MGKKEKEEDILNFHSQQQMLPVQFP